MLEGLGSAYLEAVETSKTTGEDLVACEERIVGFDHASVGALIVAHWKFPVTVVNAIQYHHGPVEQQKDPVVNLVARTNVLADRVALQDPDGAVAAFDEGALRALGLKASHVEEAVEHAVEMFPRIQV